MEPSFSNTMSSNNEGEPAAKKPKKQVGLERFLGDTLRYNKKTGKIEKHPVPPPTKPLPQQHECPSCGNSFDTLGALGNHKNHCKLHQSKEEELKRKRKAKASEVFAVGPGTLQPGKDPTPLTAVVRATVAIDNPPTKEDGRRGNRGAATRKRVTNSEKLDALEKLEMWQENMRLAGKSHRSVADYCREFHGTEVQKWKTMYSKWQKDVGKIAKAASDERYGRLKQIARGKNRSPYQDMEAELYKKIRNHRNKKRKVSMLGIKTWARKILFELDKTNKTNRAQEFKASNGWFWNFLRRKKIKFRARKSGKKKSTDENLGKILVWYGYLRHKVLTRHVGDPPGQPWCKKFGRFPPRLRYNVDQVPLPFIVNQDSTYTLDDDDDVQIAGTGKGDLRKRQFTMNVYVNAGENSCALECPIIVFKFLTTDSFATQEKARMLMAMWSSFARESFCMGKSLVVLSEKHGRKMFQCGSRRMPGWIAKSWQRVPKVSVNTSKSAGEATKFCYFVIT